MDGEVRGRRAEEELGAFLTGVGAVVDGVRSAQDRVERVAATRFSVFEYFRENENILSTIFADLLRPDGRHGQGDRFVRLFLEELDRNRAPEHAYRKAAAYGTRTDGWTVETEHLVVWHEDPARRYRRIDIVMRCGDAWIGIENKPWTDEATDQVKDYAEYLERRDAHACVLYLSGDWSDSKIPEERRPYYRLVGYRERGRGPSLEHWIDACRGHCEAESVRWFLTDLLGYLRRSFGLGSVSEEKDRE